MSKITSQINKYSDEVLCALAAGGCQDAEEELVKRYFRQVRICARPYFLAGGDRGSDSGSHVRVAKGYSGI